MVFHRADRGDDDRRRGPQTRLAALDVDEFLRAEVGAESRLGDDVVDQLHRRACRDHRIAAVRDIGEWSAVDEGRVVLQRLHEIGLDRVLQEHGHRAVGLEVASEHRLLLASVSSHDLAQALLQILERSRQAEDRHDFGSYDDIETILARVAVSGAAEAHHDLAQRPVVHVDHASPGDAAHVDAQLVPVVDMVVEHRREQVVRERDGIEVSGEVQIDVFHWHHLRVAAAGCAALHAEDGSERGLAQADHGFLADMVERVAQPHRRGGLALPRRSGCHRRYQDQLGVGPGFQVVEVLQRDLGLVMPVGLEMLLGDAELRQRDLGDALELCLLCDFDVGGHSLLLVLRDSIRA